MLLALTVTFTLIDFLHCNNLWLHPISALSLKSPKPNGITSVAKFYAKMLMARQFI